MNRKIFAVGALSFLMVGMVAVLPVAAVVAIALCMVAVLLRRFINERNVIRVVILDKAWAKVDEMLIAAPLTTENFEGIGVVPGKGGRLRIYIICDDNFGIFADKPTGQTTLMMAFDWTPPKEH